MANVNLTFGIEMEKSSVTKAQADVQKLIKSLQNELQQGDFSPLETKKYQKSIQELIKLNESLGRSYVDALEKFNVDGFLRELKRMDINLDQLQNDIEELGYEGYLSMETGKETLEGHYHTDSKFTLNNKIYSKHQNCNVGDTGNS